MTSTKPTDLSDKIAVAPMMSATHYWGRRFLRLFNAKTMIYGEMVPAPSLIFAQKLERQNQQLLYEGGNIAFQLGAANIKTAMLACQKIVAAGFKEINLNCGCPAKSVKAGAFGAVLMLAPKLVAEILSNLACEFPTTKFSIKCRIAVDDTDDEAFLTNFVETILTKFPNLYQLHVHARRALLKGLNPRQNRQVPPLHYDRVYRLKQQFPEQTIILNGGITSIAEIHQHLAAGVDGVMLGRAIMQDPFLLMAATGITITPEIKKDFIAKQLQNFLIEFDQSQIPYQKLLPFLMSMLRNEIGVKQKRTKLANMLLTAQKTRQLHPQSFNNSLVLLKAWQMTA